MRHRARRRAGGAAQATGRAPRSRRASAGCRGAGCLGRGGTRWRGGDGTASASAGPALRHSGPSVGRLRSSHLHTARMVGSQGSGDIWPCHTSSLHACALCERASAEGGTLVVRRCRAQSRAISLVGAPPSTSHAQAAFQNRPYPSDTPLAATYTGVQLCAARRQGGCRHHGTFQHLILGCLVGTIGVGGAGPRVQRIGPMRSTAQQQGRGAHASPARVPV